MYVCNVHIGKFLTRSFDSARSRIIKPFPFLKHIFFNSSNENLIIVKSHCVSLTFSLCDICLAFLRHVFFNSKNENLIIGKWHSVSVVTTSLCDIRLALINICGYSEFCVANKVTWLSKVTWASNVICRKWWSTKQRKLC